MIRKKKSARTIVMSARWAGRLWMNSSLWCRPKIVSDMQSFKGLRVSKGKIRIHCIWTPYHSFFILSAWNNQSGLETHTAIVQQLLLGLARKHLMFHCFYWKHFISHMGCIHFLRNVLISWAHDPWKIVISFVGFSSSLLRLCFV